jgi:cell division protein FtsB
MSNPQTQLFQLLADSRSRSADIQQIRQRAAARLPQAEQALIQRVEQLRSAPLGEDYLDALTDLSNIRKSIAVNDNDRFS